MFDIKKLTEDRVILFDGGMGTLLQGMGLEAGEVPERWNILYPERVKSIHRAYIEAGSNVITANTFGGCRIKFPEDGDITSEAVITAGVRLVREAIAEAHAAGIDGEIYAALDMGPTGHLLKPLCDLEFEEAVAAYREMAHIGEEAGADLIIIETMNDSLETKAALLGSKEGSSLPMVVTNIYDATGRTMTGADPAAMIALAEGMGADAVGMNCGLGPESMLELMTAFAEYASVPIVVNPNAGIPRTENGATVFDVSPVEFAEYMKKIVLAGASAVGGCCGTTPDHIRLTAEAVRGIAPVKVTDKKLCLVSSATHAVKIGDSPILIGERINPTGKAKLKAALRENNMTYILGEAVAQTEKGVHVLDVNTGLPEIDEVKMLSSAVAEIQSVTDVPLQIDTSDPAAMEAAMRLYNGKPMVNSVNGKEESLEAVLPLVKKYGGVVIALTLDENGIPETAEGRLAIARRIVERAEQFGISRKDIVADPLAMAVSSDPKAAEVTLEAIELIRRELGIGTSLGVSNVSFGLPAREVITASFFTLALSKGLDAAIMNPHSTEMMKAYRAYLALRGMDEGFAEYIDFAQKLPKSGEVTEAVKTENAGSSANAEGLRGAIIKGMRELAGTLSASALEACDPLTVINEDIIPALDEVGQGFEKGTVFLPQLLMSAEAATAAFAEAKARIPKSDDDSKGTVVIATVKGDIHDIGKNIVRVLLENYGYNVIDLGKDVPPEKIVEAAKEYGAGLVGLSALMTTTVPAMAETITQLRRSGSDAKVVVGGAVLTEEYAGMVGADKYAKDAMDTVRYAAEVFVV